MDPPESGWYERSYHPGRWSDLNLGLQVVLAEFRRTKACTVFSGAVPRGGAAPTTRVFPLPNTYYIGFQVLREVSSYQVLGLITPQPLP